MKTFTSHLRIVYYNYLVCVFTAHYACRKTEMNLKSTTTNGFTFPKIISLTKYLGGGGGRLTVAHYNLREIDQNYLRPSDHSNRPKPHVMQS